jgi:hypothetical protein
MLIALSLFRVTFERQPVCLYPSALTLKAKNLSCEFVDRNDNVYYLIVSVLVNFCEQRAAKKLEPELVSGRVCSRDFKHV